jgi:hypothetical protein
MAPLQLDVLPGHSLQGWDDALDQLDLERLLLDVLLQTVLDHVVAE